MLASVQRHGSRLGPNMLFCPTDIHSKGNAVNLYIAVPYVCWYGCQLTIQGVQLLCLNTSPVPSNMSYQPSSTHTCMLLYASGVVRMKSQPHMMVMLCVM